MKTKKVIIKSKKKLAKVAIYMDNIEEQAMLLMKEIFKQYDGVFRALA